MYQIAGDVIVPLGADGGAAPWGRIHWANPLTTTPSADRGRLVLFSGWFGEHGDTPEDPRRGLFPPSHRTWGPRAWEALDALCRGLLHRLRGGAGSVCFRPHARHILADPQSCLAFLRKHEGEPVELLLEPAAYLTPEMLARAEDHLRRAFGALGAHPAVAALVLSNIEEGPTGELEYAPLTRGRIDPGLILGFAREHAPHKPWILISEELPAQVAFVGAGGGRPSPPHS